jgi:hypothetical protein
VNTAFRSLALALLGVAAARAGQASIDPYQVEAGKPATVSVTGTSEYCSPVVTHRKAAVEGGVIILTGGWSNDPAVRCVSGPRAYKLDFDLPALKAGAYTVVNRIQPECAYAPAPCPFAFLADTGRVQAISKDSLAYHIKPDSVRAGAAFKLQVIAKDFTCGSKFTQTSVQMEGHRISVTFAHEAHPDAICPAVHADYGPEFDVPALAAGNYQVFAYRIFPCAQGQICPLLAIAPQLAGRLAAADPATGIDILYPPTVKTPGAERGDAPSPRVRWRGGTRDLSGRLPARR